MAHEKVINLAGTAVSTDHVTHVVFYGEGEASVYVAGGAVIKVAGDDADAVAKAFGRHDAKHLTAKEAKAEAKAEAADIKTHK